MLSTTECKKRLGKNNYSEREVEGIRDCLYQLVNLLVNDYLSASGKEKVKLRMVVNKRE